MPQRLFLLMGIVGFLIACGPVDAMKDDLAHSQAVSTELEKALGVKPIVGFQSTNGSLRSVTVTFQGIPPNFAIGDIAAKSKQAIAEEFKQTPTKVVIAFAVDP